MAILRLHKDALSGKFDVVELSACNLLDAIACHAPWAAQGCIVKRNGEVIADSSRHDDMEDRCDLELCTFDSVDVYCLPQADPLSWWQIALIVFASTAVLMVLMPKPKLPNDNGDKTGQNNQLNAASNAFRPREAIPDIAGEVISYPDFLQRSYYVYEANRRVFTEVFCVGRGYFDISNVKDGETLFEDISTSSFEIFEPNTAPDGLLDVRTAEGTEELPLPATDDASRSGTITNGSFLTGSEIDLGDGGLSVIETLGLAAGQSITLNVIYSIDGSQTELNENFGITAVSGSTLTLSPATLPMEDGGTVNGSLVQSAGGIPANWYRLSGNAITQIRWQLKCPQGIRKGDGTVGTVRYALEYQEVDSAGNPIGSVAGIIGVFSGNTSQAQYATMQTGTLTASRYRARAYRTSASLGDNAADQLVLERIESVTPYSGSEFGDVTTIVTRRASPPQQGRGASTKINMVAKRKLKLFNPITGTFAATYTHTRSFAQWIMYLLVERANIPIENINYQALFEIEDNLPDEQLGYFDFTFDDFDVGFKDRLQTALNVARCYYYMVGNRYMFGRDEERAIRVAAFNRRNIVPERSEELFSFYRDNQFDSVELQYVNPITNADAYIRKRINPTTAAIEDGLGDSVYEYKLNGCRNQYQAQNRAELEIRKILYQWKVVKDVVGSEALSVGIGNKVSWSDICDTELFTGEVLDQVGTTFTMSEPWTPDGVSTYYVYIVGSDGEVSSSVVATQPAGQPYQFVASGLTADLPDGYEIQRGSLYFIAPITDLNARDYIITKRGKPNERGQCQIELINYDERMYDGDDILPPAPPLVLSATGGSVEVDNASCITADASATVTATGGTGTYTYTWSKLSGNGSILSGGSTATATVRLTDVCPEEVVTGSYRCTVVSGDQTEVIDILFSAENVAIDPTPDPLTVTVFGGYNGVPNVSCISISSTATATASGGLGIYTYAWTKISGDGSITSGAATDTLTVQFTDVCPEVVKSGVYRVTASDGTNTATFDQTFSGENTQPLG